MKVGIISDTHVRKHSSKFENFINHKLQDVDLIIHAGDYTNESIIKLLKDSTKFIGVYGNNDKTAIRNELKSKEIVKIGKYNLGIYHGHGEKTNTLDNVLNEFKKDRVDIIVFGHSHKPNIFTKDNILMINPGSPTTKRKEPWFSYVILEILDDGISASLHFFK